jgi:Mrp family chromosome partitioning ATPase
LFGIDRSDEPSVVDVLAGTATVDQALSETDVDGLKIMTAGEPPDDPDLLLRSKYFRQLKSRISDIADIVVYDSPPVLVVSDPLLLAEDVDLTILVTEAESTKRKAARRGAEALNRPNSGTTVAVLTKQRTGITGYGYDYRYANYYGVGGRRERARRLARSLASRVLFWKDGNSPAE